MGAWNLNTELSPCKPSGRDRCGGMGPPRRANRELKEEALHVPQEEVQENVEIKNEKDRGPDEEVQAETTDIPPLDPVLAQHIMTFSEGISRPWSPSHSASSSTPSQSPYYCYCSQGGWRIKHGCLFPSPIGTCDEWY
uniref:Uncharacterized protein n=1 Tax=Solanum tuberosum TaxID=4113 RepID=M1DWW7_SOLTU